MSVCMGFHPDETSTAFIVNAYYVYSIELSSKVNCHFRLDRCRLDR